MSKQGSLHLKDRAWTALQAEFFKWMQKSIGELPPARDAKSMNDMATAMQRLIKIKEDIPNTQKEQEKKKKSLNAVMDMVVNQKKQEQERKGQ